jgi:hypothetical protein
MAFVTPAFDLQGDARIGIAHLQSLSHRPPAPVACKSAPTQPCSLPAQPPGYWISSFCHKLVFALVYLSGLGQPPLDGGRLLHVRPTAFVGSGFYHSRLIGCSSVVSDPSLCMGV